MTRANRPAAARAAGTGHRPGRSDPADPLEPLLDAVQEALVQRVTMVPTRGRGSVLRVEGLEFAVGAGKTLDPRQPGVQLRRALEHVVADALRSSVGAPTAEGRRLRLTLAHELLAMDAGEPGGGRGEVGDEGDSWLRTAEVAARLGVSRPHVSMLCDAGKLGEPSRTEGGHRRIRRSAVDAYLAARKVADLGARSPREAAVVAGMYAVSDKAYAKAARRPAAGPVTQSARSRPKPGRALDT
ncbi:MAG: helix-turn-helix domain-containing protein [Burkholderiales bacterium]|nr:helix-turn-helix domain-containing protein [Burkholderiales bacterium]